MPLAPEFLARAERNEALLKSFDLDTTAHLDWAVTVCFYTALRYVDALAYAKGQQPSSHGTRNRWVRWTPETSPIWNDYFALYQASRQARYELLDFSPSEVRGLIENELAAIKNRISQFK